MDKYAADKIIFWLKRERANNGSPVELIDAAIAVLEQAERWETFIAVASSLDKEEALAFIAFFGEIDAWGPTRFSLARDKVRALLSALPEPPEGGKVG